MIALIDLDPIIHIVAPVQWSSGNRTNAKRVRDHVFQFVNNVLKSTNCTEYLMFFQDIGHDNFRKIILPEYKGHRKSSEAVDTWKSVICKELLHLGAIPLYEIESDDALALWVTKCKKERKDYLIVENDKDLAMLSGNHYNPFKTQPKNKPKIERWYEYTHEQSVLSHWCQVASGDPTDMPNSLCGIELIGPGKAKKALEGLHPELYSAKVMQMYTKKYGISKGLRRMALTYDMVTLLFDPTKDIYESEKVLKCTPKKFADPVDDLFENKPTIKTNLFE